ncbi:F-box/WD-40 repeat-containing protein [Raphanus sativus]|uniref:F-box/WD-40 repeat-containing protein At3g52030 n=1 Tax=Raphanus sativus TaxID=3726 RepID=A0A6J0NDH9_RAPSA|nr:F-box/WD-40 repeat-containing protein At3g52030 [Raphanus sativus]KAJ4900171.1 F-box/WD-40 repeat-containing protein [Raphanus sativus]
MGITETVGEPSARKMRRRASPPTSSIESLDADILLIIFSFLDLFDLVNCTVVCNSWHAAIKKMKLLQSSCRRMHQLGSSTSLGKETPEINVEEFAMKHHKMALLRGRVEIERWEAHSHRFSQCRMKKGLLLTGVGDKVMRLWSLNSYKCMEEYSLPDAASLIDFDFDESKIVGLVGTRISIWRRSGQRSIFPSREGTIPKGLCMRYIDPEAVVGCEDGTARVFDMYSKTCSQIIRTHGGPITCLSLSDNQLFLSGSSLGRVTVSDPLVDQPVATLKSTITAGGIQTICFNQGSNLAFSGTTAGYVSCWDIRKMRQVWENRVSPNVVYSIQQLRNDTSVMVAGGIDGVLRVIDQKSGRVLSSCIMDDKVSTVLRRHSQVVVEKRRGKRVSQDVEIDKIERKTRPQISCIAMGMKKVVTAHSGKFISVWKFNHS